MERRRKQAGQALATVALAMVVLLGFMGLAVDMGYLRYMKRRMQSAADSAAIAGAAANNYGGDVASAAKADSAKDGFTDGSNGIQVIVNNPPTSGQHVTPQDVEVVVSQDQPTFFMKIFGVTSVPLSARAVGSLVNAKGSVYGLDGGNAITANSNADVDVPKGAVIANGDLVANDDASIVAASIGVTGSVTNNGATLSPTPQQGIAPVSDPLSYLPKPAVGGCTNLTIGGNGSRTVVPGTYCQITIRDSVDVTFNAGLYVLTQNGLTVSDDARVTGTDVTFFNSGSGSITINGNAGDSARVNLSAPATGTYAGILFFQDGNDTSSANINGRGASTLQGALYFPNASLTMNAGGSPAYMIAVAKTIVFNGDANFNHNFSSLPGGSPIKTAVLAE